MMILVAVPPVLSLRLFRYRTARNPGDCRPFWGAGISYGYVVPLNRCWGAEFTLGAGFVNVKYDQFYNIPNGARYGHGLTHTYWGVTRAGITLLYRFGFKKEDR